MDLVAMRQIYFTLISLIFSTSISAQNTNNCSTIDTNLCYASQPYPVVNFAIEKKFESIEETAVYQSPLLADINGDCIPEIIMAGTTGFITSPRLTSGIKIVNSLNGQNIINVPTAFYSWHAGNSYLVADIFDNGSPLIILAAADHNVNPMNIRGRLVCYDFQGNIIWISNEQFGSNASYKYGGTIGIADFNQDGVPEIYIYNEIFNAQTGVKLCDGGSNGIGHGFDSFLRGTVSVSIAANLDLNLNDLELAAGYSIYKISLTNLTGSNGNTMIPYNIAIDGIFHDGFTSIGDINGDGILDVIVSTIGSSNSKLYTYQLNNNTAILIAETTSGLPLNGAILSGPPFIGDIDGSGSSSIGLCRPLLISTYKYNGTSNLELFWQIPTNDASGETGLTMFDFNQDGVQEIVYRDETTLRILNGSTNPPIDLASFSCISGTGIEHPVVGDIDNTGESKICVTCGVNSVTLGKIEVFGVPSNQQPWAPSRGIWNQYAYHVFNVNDDLTIPTQQLNNATYANGAYNNFYVQASLLDENGNFLQQVPDLVGEITCVNYDWTTQEYTAVFSITNAINASMVAPSGIPIAFFNGDPQTNGNLIGITNTTASIAPGDTINNLSFTFTAANLSSLNIVLNSDGSTSGSPYMDDDFSVLECGYLNNLSATLNLPVIEELNETICANQTYDYYSAIYTETGTYYYSVQDENGCDSLVSKLNLIVHPIYEFNESIVACDTFVWPVNGQTYSSTGIYTEVLQTQFGCDSTLILNLTINESVTSSEIVSSCDSFTWTVNGQTYSSSGVYAEILQTQLGCDSTLILNLTIHESISSTETVSICEEYTWPVNGQTYTISGTQTEVLQTQFGCDSIVILDLTIFSSNGSQTNLTACNNFTWNGQNYLQSGTYTFQTINSNGCDSIAVLNLTIHNSVQTQEIIQVCEWEEENVLEFAFTTIYGCDSLHTVIYERYPLSQLPIASFSTSPTTTVMLPPGVIQTFNSSQNANTYLWNFGDGSGTTNETNPTHTFENEGQYEILLVANNNTNCADTSVQLIIVQNDLLIYVPNAFTPDGDNFNPIFLPIINGDFDPYKYKLLIYNRWGEVVFESRNAEFGWDGTYGGKIVQDGNYIWKIRLQSKTNDKPKEFVGHVNVLR
jgi:gliding motility-associated-like protein